MALAPVLDIFGAGIQREAALGSGGTIGGAEDGCLDAMCLSSEQARRPLIIGLTKPRNRTFCGSLGCLIETSTEPTLSWRQRRRLLLLLRPLRPLRPLLASGSARVPWKTGHGPHPEP